MNKLKQIPEFLRFVMVGLFATGLHYGIYFVLQKFIQVNVAYTLGYVLSIGLLNLFLRLGFSRPLAPIPVFLIAIPVNFLLVRFVFKQK